VKGNFHARFLEGWAAVRLPGHSIKFDPVPTWRVYDSAREEMGQVNVRVDVVLAVRDAIIPAHL
jgi:hypothetical protein